MGKSAAERANSILREAAIRYARMKVDKVGQKGVLGPDGDKYRDRAIANPDKIPEECWKGQREKYEELLNAAEEKGSDDDSDEEKDTEEVKDSEEEDDDEKPKEELPIKRKASSIPKAMSAKKTARTDSGAGPSDVYNWAKLEAKMEMKQEEMYSKMEKYFATYKAKFEMLFDDAQRQVNEHAAVYHKAMEKTDAKVANAEKAAEMAKQQVEDLKGTTIRTVTYTADEKYSMAQLCKLLSVNPELGNIMAAKMGIELTPIENANGPSSAKPRTRGGAKVAEASGDAQQGSQGKDK